MTIATALTHGDNHPVTTAGANCQASSLPEVDTVLAQYVVPSKLGLFRIIRHGHRWRTLLDERELGRHTAASAALTFLRDTWPRARLPMTLDRWRYLPGPMQTGLTVHMSMT